MKEPNLILMHHRIIFALIFSSMVMLSCEEETGACESEIVNFQGYTLFTCRENKEPYLCEGSDDHFWVDKSCANLGYPFFNETNESWQAGANNNSVPGKHGYWGDKTASGSGSGSGGTGACDASGYQGPEFDIQVDSQCKAAYAYQCSGNAQGIAATCAIYQQFKDDNPGIPDCPYCS